MSAGVPPGSRAITPGACGRVREARSGESQAVVTVLAVRLFYVDDSGNETITTFSAVSVPVQAWTAALDSWLGWQVSQGAVLVVRACLSEVYKQLCDRVLGRPGDPAGAADAHPLDQASDDLCALLGGQPDGTFGGSTG
jgi:hypothetical protein